jgi:serine/threonine protein kinase
MIKADLLDEYKEFIFREIEMFGQLNHPNIVKYYGHFSEKEKFYIVFEYVNECDFKSYLKRTNLYFKKKLFYHFLVN